MTLIVNTSQTISSDQTPATGRAIEYGADAVTLTIDDGFFVKSQDNFAIFSANTHALSVLINNGDILSATSDAVAFAGIDGSIVNNAGRSIIGAIGGIDCIGTGDTITNHGTVIGLTDAGVVFHDQNTLTNDGDIYGRFAGAEATGGSDGGTIVNSGTIRSDKFGINIFTNSGLSTVINNSGTIAGTTAAIQADSGGISLNNHGTVKGSIICSPDEDPTDIDTVRNAGKITGEVHLGIGNDSFNGKGGTSGAIFGEDGDDALTGGGHKDTLVGGLGLDRLKGGGAADHFSFVALADSVVGASRDVILDFTHSQHDKIDLHLIDANSITGGDQAFHFIGSGHFHHAAGELRYANHILQGDVDGDGAADFQIHVNAANLAKGDFVL